MKTTVIKPHKSSIGDLNANIMAMLIFVGPAVLGFIPVVRYVAWAVPLVIFFLEKKSKFVKFYAVTSIVISIISFVFYLIIGILTLMLGASARRASRDIWYALEYYSRASRVAGLIAFLGVFTVIISIIFLALFVYLIIMSISYKQVELPLVGPLALKLSDKMDAIGGGSKSTKKSKKKDKEEE